MSIRLGMEATLFWKADGVGGPGTWNELTNVKDVTLTLEKGEADVTTRANAGWRATVGTLKEGTVEWEMIWDTADGGFTAVKNAFFEGTVIGLRILDGPGGSGLEADFSITNFSRSEPLEEALSVSVSAKVTYSTTPPSWINGSPAVPDVSVPDAPMEKATR